MDQGFLRNDFFQQSGSQSHKIEAENQYRAFVRSVDNISPFFVVSFCRHDSTSFAYQNGLLSQWRGYAGGGGFAIEFDEEKLDLQAKHEQSIFAYIGFRSDNVEYADHASKFNAVDYQGLAGSMIYGVFASEGLDVSHVTGRKDVNEVVMKYAQTAPFLKHPAFYEEAEYRLVFVCLRKNKIQKEERRPAKVVKFRQRGGLLIPYIENFGSGDLFSAIKSIIVGPHPRQEEQEEAVRMLLESSGLKVEVRKSQIPYRQ